MKLLAFSDLHQDHDAAQDLVERSGDADLVVGAGDFASIHEGLEETIDALAGIEAPTVLVPGNNETEDALRAATADWAVATVLHGELTSLDGVEFFGLGAGVPITPWDWSFDLSDEDAATLIADAPAGGVWALHSPPKGHCDVSGSGDHLGSAALAEGIAAKAPQVAVCGHIHESWGAESEIGETRVFNLAPQGREIDV